MPARVLFTSHTMDPAAGGAERVLTLLLERAASRFEVHLAAPFEPAVPLAAPAVAAHVLPPFRVRAGLKGLLGACWTMALINWKMLALLRRTRPGVVHVNSLYALYFTALPARLAGIPVVYHEHGLPSLRAKSHWQRGFRLLLRQVTHTIAITGAVRDELLAAGARREDVSVIWNGVEADAGDHAERSAAPAVPTIGVIANLHRWKRQDLCIRALAELRRSGVEAQLLLVGSESVADYANELRELARDLGVENRVEFAGFRRDAQALLRTMTCLVVASDSEPFGLVILEAMRAGVPVVASAGGGVPEIVQHGVDGLLFPPGDWKALARELQRVFASPDLRRSLATAGHESLRRRFTIEVQADRVFSQLEAAAGRRERAA